MSVTRGANHGVYSSEIIKPDDAREKQKELLEANKFKVTRFFDWGTIMTIASVDILLDAKVLRGKFVLTDKDQDGNSKYKARFVIDSHDDPCYLASAAKHSTLVYSSRPGACCDFLFQEMDRKCSKSLLTIKCAKN